MKSVIVGTAGHIDHGKTSLVKALTGVDADRLEEEKRRGITIDLGFANLELPAPDSLTSKSDAGGLRLGFVDVPGHERFVRNMLAGIGGIDLVLFVIAADEGIMPQTREHFDICRLLGIRRGITVLTKADLVDAESLGVVRMEVEEFLRGTFLDAAQAPVVAVSTLTGAGMDELKAALAQVASQAAAKDAAALARLPIDRVFTMKGFGTVVTGTLIAGTVTKESELEVFPVMAGAPARVRVRGVQVHGAAAEAARAGERTALNLAGVSVDQLGRGQMLATPGVFAASQRIEARLQLLSSAKPLKHRAKVHFHAYAGEQVAEVHVLASGSEAKSVAPGGETLVQLRLSEPVLLVPGDRFILRQFSPVVTIGGGEVVDAHPLARAAKEHTREQAAAWRQALAGGSPEERLGARIARRGAAGLSAAQAVAETGWRREQVEQLAAALEEARSVVRAGELWLDAGAFQQLATAMLKAVRAFHEANPLVAGMGARELEEKLGVPGAAFGFTLAALVRAGKLAQAGEVVHVAGRGVQMKDDEAEARAEIERAFATAGLQVPALKEVLAGLKVDRARAQKIVTLMLREKALVKVSEELVFHGRALEELRARVKALRAAAGTSSAGAVVKMDVARFKEMTGVSRKYAIPLLEWLDRERVTRRVGDERVVL